jgi:hypothetical protein
MPWWVTLIVYAGLALVLIGPALGTYLPIRNARTPAARRFLIRVSMVFWAAALLLGVLPVLLVYHGILPQQATAVAFLMFLTLPAIPWLNRRLKKLEAPAAGSKPTGAGRTGASVS